MTLAAAIESAAWAALETVRDPELDEPVTTLGFVASCTVSPGGQATVRLRLPTYFCAPNFAYLMVADAYDAVTRVEGVTAAEVILEDHFASDAINGGGSGRCGVPGSIARRAGAERGGHPAGVPRQGDRARTARGWPARP